MVSQFAGQRDSPVDPCEGISHDFGDTDGFPSLLDTDHSLYQLDVRLCRHKAAWINPLCAQEQPLQDLRSSSPAGQNSGTQFVVDTPSPLGLSSLTCGDSSTETPLSENTADPSNTSAHGSGEKSGDFSLTREERRVLWRGSQHASLLKNPQTVSTSPSPQVSSACFESSHWTASADEDAVQNNRGSHSVNFFSAEKTFVLPVDVEKEDLHFYAADMVISVMEKMKCNLLSQRQPEIWGPEEASRSPGNDQTNAEATFYTHAKQELGSSSSSDSGYEGTFYKCEYTGCCSLHAHCLSSVQS